MSARVRTDLLAILDATELASTCFASEKVFFADEEVIVAQKWGDSQAFDFNPHLVREFVRSPQTPG
jgi:hypothetical protein